MTYVEFFEKDDSENVCACFTHTPDRVVFIGDKAKLMRERAERYSGIFADRDKQIEFICKAVNKNNIASIVEALSDIIDEYGDCVFDLTGGEELYLVAMGIVFERYRDRNIQMHRFNLRNNTILDCDQDGNTISEGDAPQLSVEENIRLYGGDVIYDDQRCDATYDWDLDDDFRADIDAMWNICSRDVRQWNTQLGVLAAAEKFRDVSKDPLTDTVSLPILKDRVSAAGGKYVFFRSIFSGLYDAGLLLSYECDEETFSVTYKNERVKRCLIKEGQALEMKIYAIAAGAYEKDGSTTYNDVKNGVHIDWDGKIETESGHDTENEIDVMMMRGMVPVFVSCKNGQIKTEELYKLNSVANRFGGKYAKKILVATALGKDKDSERIRQRAKDMNIRMVEGIQTMSDSELQKLVRTFWSA